MLSGASWKPRVRQGAEPAGLEPGAGDALQMCPWSRCSPGLRQQLPVEWGWQPLRRETSARAVAEPEGRRQLQRSEDKDGARLSKSPPSTSSPAPPPPAQAPRWVRELGGNVFVLGSCLAVSHKCWNQADWVGEPGGLGGNTRLSVSQTFRSSLEFPCVSAVKQIISKNRDTIFFKEMQFATVNNTDFPP